MCERHGRPPAGSQAATAVDRATNLLSFIYAQIYFPTYSNGLKEITGYLGFRWSGSLTSGLETIVWRHRWEASRDPAVKQTLLDYNRQDCEALELVANRLVDLHRAAPADGKSSQGEVVLTSDMKRKSPYSFKRIAFVFPEMEIINKAAYWDYQRERVYVKSRNTNRRRRRPANIDASRNAATPNTTIEYSRPSSCPHVQVEADLSPWQEKQDRNRSYDLCGMESSGGSRGTSLRGIDAHHARSTFYAARSSLDRGQIRSQSHRIYDVPKHRAQASAESRRRQREEIIWLAHSSGTRQTNSRPRQRTPTKCTYDHLLKRLCTGRLLHVDETSVGVKGKNGYVWVLTSLEEVAYFYTPTRAGDTIQAMLKDFSGVLVSDFYAAYDAIECPQQKCLIHFIRDLNDDLLKHPYDDELKQLVAGFCRLGQADG